VGADGILLGPLQSEKGDFRLRIFNPDGSEAQVILSRLEAAVRRQP